MLQNVSFLEAWVRGPWAGLRAPLLLPMRGHKTRQDPPAKCKGGCVATRPWWIPLSPARRCAPSGVV